MYSAEWQREEFKAIAGGWVKLQTYGNKSVQVEVLRLQETTGVRTALRIYVPRKTRQSCPFICFSSIRDELNSVFIRIIHHCRSSCATG